MSTYTTSSAGYRGHLATLRAALPGLEAQADGLSNGITSVFIAEMLTEIREDCVQNAQDAEYVWHRVEQAIPGWDRLFSDATYGELSAVSSQIESLAGMDEEDVATYAGAAYDDLLDGLEAAAEEVAGYERVFTAEAVDLALRDLGYSVARAEGSGITAFEASRGHEKLLVQVTVGGDVATDHLGLSDGVSCGAAQRDFVASVSRYGVTLDEEERRDHRDPRGGSLAQGAAQVAGDTLVERIVNSYAGTVRGRSAPARASLRTEIA